MRLKGKLCGVWVLRCEVYIIIITVKSVLMVGQLTSIASDIRDNY